MSHKMGVENGQGVQYKSFPLSHLLSFEIDGLSKAEKDKDFLLLAKKKGKYSIWVGVFCQQY